MTVFLAFLCALLIYLLLWELAFNRQAFVKKFTYRTTLTSREKKRFKADFCLFLGDVIRLIQAGIPLQEALEIAAQDNGPLVQEAILMPIKRISYGEPSQEAWHKATQHFRLSSFDHFVLILQVQHEMGGSIAEMLEKLLQMMQAKEKIAHKIKALTAEGRLSGIIIALLPPVLLCLLGLLGPTYLGEFMAHELAPLLMSIAALFWLMGVFFLVKLTRVADD